MQDLTDREQTHHQSSGVQSVHQLPVTKSQALYAGNRVNAEAAQHNADQRANQTLEQIVRRHGDDHSQTHQGHGEILPVTEDQETLDNCGARKNRARAENVPPIREAKTPIDSAVPGLPLLAMG